MILKFIFLYKHSNKDYFLKLLQNTATKFDLRHYNMLLNNECLFFVNGNEENLSLFANQISFHIPLSIYFILKSVEVSKEMAKSHLPDIAKQTSTFDFNLIETLNIKDINSPNFCDIFSYPKYSINFDIFFDNNKLTSKENLKDSILQIAKMLKNGHVIHFQTQKGKVYLSIKNDNFDIVMANDISTISLYTRANKDELDALATFEKPSINLNIKDVFINELGFRDALFILPFDPILCALSSVLVNLEIPFLFLSHNVKNKINIKSGISYNNEFKDKFFEIVLGANGYFITKKFLENTKKEDLSKKNNNFNKNIEKQDSPNDFINNAFEINNTQMLVVYLSINNNTMFKIPDSSNLVNIEFDMNPKNIINELSKTPTGKKLILNYKKAFPEYFENVQSFDSKPILTNNILDIFSSISVILNYSKTLKKDKIFEYANLFLRDIGPKIDFKMKNINNGVFYNHLSTISSTISFSLAGVEKEMICYGVFDSLADFFITISYDANFNYGIKDIGIIGDLFSNKIFFNKVTKKFPPSLILHFPNYIDQI